MNLFSFGKPKPPEDGFQFRVDNAFSIKGQGVVLTEQITRDVIRKGDTVTCRKARHFPCTVRESKRFGPSPQSGVRPGR